MPKPLPPELDAGAFAERLKLAMKHAGRDGRGAGARLARRHGVKDPTASAWLSGKHMPEPSKVRLMADDFGVDYDWLYFGTEKASQSHMVRDEPAPYFTQLSAAEIEMVEAFRACSPAVQKSLLTLAQMALK